MSDTAIPVSNNGVKIFTPEEHQAWVAFLSNPTEERRNDLMLRYMPVVKFVVGRLISSMPPNVEASDLASEGMFGLAEAVTKFDPSRGVKFQTYASTRIRGAILDSMRASDWMPRTIRTRVKTLDKAIAELTHNLQRDPTDEEIAEATEFTLEEVRDLKNQQSVIGGFTVEDMEAIATEKITTYLADPTTKIAVHTAINTLPDRDRLVLTLYFFDGLTLNEIGAVLDITESRVSQIRSRALKKLKLHFDS